jgi:hypothetical protein
LTPALLCLAFPLVPLFVDPAARQFAADVSDAIDRAGLSRKGVAIDLGVPLNKLCDQLNGKTPFTYFWRFVAGLDDDFKRELWEIQAARVNAVLLAVPDLRELVCEVRELVGRKRMAKSSLMPHQERQVS